MDAFGPASWREAAAAAEGFYLVGTWEGRRRPDREGGREEESSKGFRAPIILTHGSLP
jgi:hypothetical protein